MSFPQHVVEEGDHPALVAGERGRDGGAARGGPVDGVHRLRAAVDNWHDRAFASSDVSTVNVLCTVETRNHEHFAQLRAHLKAHGVETYDAK